MFVRSTNPKILDHPTPKANGPIKPKINGQGVKSRQSVVAGHGRRESVLGPAVAKRQSINAGSPTPRPQEPSSGRVLRSPTKSPTKHLTSSASSGNSTPQSVSSLAVQKPSVPGLRPTRPSMGPPPAPSSNVRPPRQSISGRTNGLARPTSTSSASSNHLSLKPGLQQRLGSISGDSQPSASSGYNSPIQNLEPERPSPPVADVLEEISANDVKTGQSNDSLQDEDKTSGQPNGSRTRSPTTKAQKPAAANSTLTRETEDLRTKLRVMEKKRMEDREKLKTLDRVKGERDKFEGIIQKLQSKYQPQQQETADLRKQLKEMDEKIKDLEKQQAENDVVVEGATLDREMAEETAESLRNELGTLKQSHEELQLEVEVLREENQELSKEMSPEEKTGQGWLQMERSNERLREALMRLRDVTQEQEADLREQIAELERDIHGLKGAREEQVQLEMALEDSQSAVTELRQQLEAAFGAEDMVEELGERNLALNEQIENLKASIEELESLKELNDELEINHTENAKQMQEEIDYSESLLAEQAKKAVTQDQNIQDLEYTVNRFRSLVTNMQTDLEEMRTSQQLTEAEANDLSSRSRAVMDLNLRLQASASKAQVKAIDLELGRLDAQESVEHLSIVELFLPPSLRTERNSVRAYLRCKRIKLKAGLLYDQIKEKASRQPSAGHETDVFVCCNVLNKLTVVSQMCNRLEQSVQSCNLEEFNNLESALFDLEPVERTFNTWIETAKRDELKEESCATELSRSIALLTHLAEVHIGHSLDHYANDIHARALIMQSQLESILMALAHTKAVAEVDNTPSEVQDDDGNPDPQRPDRQWDSLMSQIRSSKVITGKAIRQLDDLQSRSLTLEQTTLNTIEQSQTSVTDLSDFMMSFGASISRLSSEDGQKSTSSGQQPQPSMQNIDRSYPLLVNKIHTTTTHLQAFYSLTTNLNRTIEYSPLSRRPPWQLLAEKLASETITLASREEEIARLNDENREKSTTVALRDKSVEELNVKLETLEKRVAESGGRRERVRELENILEAAKAREVELINTVNRLRSERNDLRAQRESWVSRTGAPGASATVDIPTEPDATVSRASVDRIANLEREIETLQAAIRHLHSTSYSRKLSSAWDFLGTPLIPHPSPREQRLELKQSEAKDVVHELLRIATDPINGVVKLRERKFGERLGWRPVRETCSWQADRAKEEWEEWREWRDDLAGRRKAFGMEGRSSGKRAMKPD
ncbi:MAG: hypothetical protein Q9219_005562 [cf. Caloplaca sp. 3 TL-2023]